MTVCSDIFSGDIRILDMTCYLHEANKTNVVCFNILTVIYIGDYCDKHEDLVFNC